MAKFTLKLLYASLLVVLTTGAGFSLPGPLLLQEYLRVDNEEYSLIVKSASSSIIFPGGSFRLEASLKQNGLPVQHATIGIYDPVLGMCNIRETNGQGELSYISKTEDYTTPAIYTYVFKYGDIQTPFNVSVGLVNAINLSMYNVDAIGTSSLPKRTLVLGRRTSDQPFSQDLNSTLAEGDNLARQVTEDVLSNPGTVGIFLFTGLSCLATLSPAAPVSAGPCLVGLQATTTSIGLSILTRTAKMIIDTDDSLDAIEKKNRKKAVDIAGVTIGVFALDPGNGLFPLELLSQGWELGEVITTSISGVNGKPKGVCCTANIKGTDKVLSISFYKKDASDYLKPVAELYYDAFVTPFVQIGVSSGENSGNDLENSQGDKPNDNSSGTPSRNNNHSGSYNSPGGYSTQGSYSVPGYYTIPGYSKSSGGYTTKGQTPKRKNK